MTNFSTRMMPSGLTAVTLATVLVMAGCGGGGGDSAPSGPTTQGPLTLSGVVAARTAAPSRTVDVKCASGTGTATSNSDGSYTVTVTEGQLPCVLRAAGTADGDLYSVAYGSGRTATANLTPLTQLVVASMAAGTPATFYSNFGADTAALVTAARVDAAVSTVQADLTTRGINASGVGNPVTAVLVPAGTTQTGNTYGQVLAGLEANLTTAGMTLAQLTTSVVSASPTVRLPAALLSQPQASNCAALRSGKHRFFWIRPSELKSNGDYDSTASGVIDATMLTSTNEFGTVSRIAANGTCRYKGTTGVGGDPADVVVSQAGVMLMTSTIDGVKRLGIGFPEQSLPLADLAGEYNLIQLESNQQGVVAGNGVTFRLNASGAVESAACQPSEVLARTCTPFSGPFPKLSVNAAGGFTMASTDPADPWTSRWFAYRTGSGDVMLMQIGRDGTFGFATPRVANTLPSVGGISRSWGTSMDMSGVASGTTFGESSLQTKSVDSVSNSSVRTARNLSLTTDDSHDETVWINWPRTGYRYRAAGSAPAPDGTVISFREWISLSLRGTGVSVTYVLPTATQAGVMSFGVTQ